jgi:hypothetical protein
MEVAVVVEATFVGSGAGADGVRRLKAVAVAGVAGGGTEADAMPLPPLLLQLLLVAASAPLSTASFDISMGGEGVL